MTLNWAWIGPFLEWVGRIAILWLISGGLLSTATNMLVAIATSDRAADSRLEAALRQSRRFFARVTVIAGLVLVAFAIWATVTPAPATPSEIFAAGIHGASNCIADHPADDAIVAVRCDVGGADAAHFYRFRNTTAETAWMAKLAVNVPPGQCESGSPARSTWTTDTDTANPAGELACFEASDGSAALFWSIDAATAGGSLTRSDGNLRALYTAWRTLSVGRASIGDPATPCADHPVKWDESGAGHDAWPSSRLDLMLADCVTVIISSGSFETPNQEECDGGIDAVCVMVWSSSERGVLHVDSLQPGATWWSYADVEASAAIQDKASLFNPKGWFGSANCSTSTGCNEARVWIISDGFVAKATIPHP